MTTTLMSIAEVSNVFSIFTVFVVFLAMVIFILRLHGNDFRLSSSTSVTYVSQMPVQQTPMIKINNPFIFKLEKSSSNSTNDVRASISSQNCWRLHEMWGVTIAEFHRALLSSTWTVMREQILNNTFLTSSTVYQKTSNYLPPCVEDMVRFSPPENSQWKQLGTAARSKYPLIVILLRDDQSDDIHALGALINVIHISDEEFQMPSCVLAQYLKMVDGQLSVLKPLYVSNVDAGNVSDGEEAAADRALCVICHSEVVSRVLLPCRHACTCRRCFRRLDKCPMCRSRISSYFCMGEESSVEAAGEYAAARHQVSGWRRRFQVWHDRFTQLLTP